jgi:cytochrome c peroxidase
MIRRSFVRTLKKQQQQVRFSTTTSAPPPPPPPPPPKGGSGGIWLIGAAALAGGAYYFQDDIKALVGDQKKTVEKKVEKATEKVEKATEKAEKAVEKVVAKTVEKAEKVAEKTSETVAVAKEELDKLQQALVKPVAAATPKVDWNKVRDRVVDLLEDEKWDDGSWGPVFVRLAWHASGTYDKNNQKGGSDGALMRFSPESIWGANAGLAHARARLEPLKREFPGATFCDLWSFAGTVSIEEMGGPKMNWTPGRKDVPETPKQGLPDGLLPDADGRDKKDHPADHLRDIFGRMGFNDREIVALSGAHALGRCHTDRSGYWGPWTRAPTTFSNEYYRLLLEEKWTPKTTHKGAKWEGPLQYEDKTGELMMLPTDLSLVQDKKMRPIVEEYAKDEKKFFDDFAKAWIKLQELGVRSINGRRRYWIFGPRE